MNAGGTIFWESKVPAPIATRVAIAGDFLASGNLAFPNAKGWGAMASGLAPHFEDVAISFLNLECVLNASDLAARRLNGIGRIVAAPAECLEYLAAIRSIAVGIANNHTYDFGAAGVERTRSHISRCGFVPLGAGFDLRDKPEVFVWQGPGDLRIGFWAAAKATHHHATNRSPGVEPANPARAAEALEAMRNRGAQFCVALLHCGCLRTNYPAPEDARLVDVLAASGFDLVCASHSHRISGAKVIAKRDGNPAFCFYGLGSTVSGDIASPLEREGLIVVAGFDSAGSLSRMEVRPVFIGESGFGEVPPRAMSETIIDRFSRLSAEISDGSYKRHFFREISSGLIQLYVRDIRAAYRESGIRGLAFKAKKLRIRHLERLAHRLIR